MRYFITGSTGFIGSRLVQSLIKSNENVTVLLHSNSSKSHVWLDRVQHAYVSLFNRISLEEKLREQDIVIHLAYGNKGSLEERHKITVEGTQSLLDASLNAGVKRFIHISTVSVYGEPPLDAVYSENSPRYASLNPYVAAKQQAELAALAMCKEGLDVVILQPAIVYGPGSSYWTAEVIEILKRSTFPLINGGSGLCNAIYVDDVVDGILKAVNSPSAKGECFILSNDEPVTWQKFFESYQNIIGRNCLFEISAKKLQKIYDFPKPFNKLARLIPLLTGNKPIAYLDYERIRFFASKPIFSNQKAKDVLQFTPSHDLHTGISRVRNWFLESK